MYQNPTLTQQMSDLKLADMRREARARRNVEATRLPVLRFTRPLGKRAGH